MADKIIHRVKLDSIKDILAEIKKLYKEARSKSMETTELTRFVSVLHILVNIIRDSDLESRIQALESFK